MTDSEELVDSDFMVKGSVFPNEFVSPKAKERPEYGLHYVKGMYYSSSRYGGYHFWDDNEYQALIEVAQGRQSVDSIRKMLGFFKDPNDDAQDEGAASLAYIDVQVLNLAPKYINRAVSKIMAVDYDVSIEAIDAASVHEKKTYEASIQAFYEYRTWIEDMKMNPRDFFPDLDVDILPEYPDELMFEMLTNPKLKKAINGELAISLAHEINDFKQKMRMVAWDMVTLGRGHLHTYRDANGVPRADKINPKYFIGSYVEDENFDGQEYAGFFDFPTVNEFRKEARASLTEEEIEKVVQHFSYQNSIENAYHPARENQKYDGLNYIPVLRFYFLSQDERLYITRENNYGNTTMMERGLKWKPREDDENFKNGKSRIIRNEYTSVYGGTWVLDSDIVYDYGKKNFPRTNLVDAKLPIITFSPNYKEGRTVSFVSQMIEPLLMVNVTWNKIKEILAKGWMGVQEIDFTQLEEVALGAGGRKWRPRDVYEHFLQTGRLIKRSPVNKYDQRYSNSAIDSNPTGLQLADYFNAFTTAIQMLEQMTNTGIAESVNQPDRLAVKVAQMSQMAGNMDMEYLFNGYEYLFKRGSESLLQLIQEAKRDGIGIEGFISALGMHFSVPDEVAYCDYGLFVKRAPGPEEWIDFYNQLSIGLEKGTVTHLDVAYIREIRNLKKARQILGIRIKINERKVAQMQSANNQAAMEANRVAAADKTQGKLAEIQAKAAADRENIILQGKISELLMMKEKQLDSIIKGVEQQVKKEISKQQSIDEIVKQALRNKVEALKVEKREDKSPED
jgi:hypothetical protein